MATFGLALLVLAGHADASALLNEGANCWNGCGKDGGLCSWCAQYCLLRAARAHEEHMREFSADVIADRSAMPLKAISLPAGAMGVASWVFVDSVVGLIDASHEASALA